MKISFPARVEQFADCVPHRPPMVWIDEVLSATSEGGECRVLTNPNALYFKNGRIEPLSCIEWIAQCFAFVRSALLIEAGLRDTHKAAEAFLVGIRNADLLIDPDDAEFQTAKELRVHVSRFREFGPIIMVDGEVRLLSGRVVMQANLRVYHGINSSDQPKH